jgi:5-formyltetrahydrofolate cyclo-ligase
MRMTGQAADPDRPALRRRLLAERRAIPDRADRDARLLAAWLAERDDTVVGGYWPIRGEFDALAVLGAWLAARDGRTASLPVIDAVTGAMTFHAWFPGCRMVPDWHGIPMPDGTSPVVPTLLLVPCVGFGRSGLRLGYGGGYYDRTLGAMAPNERPATLGIALAHGHLPELAAHAHDVPLDAILTEDGLVG